jgi:hypothetical protein
MDDKCSCTLTIPNREPRPVERQPHDSLIILGAALDGPVGMHHLEEAGLVGGL